MAVELFVDGLEPKNPDAVVWRFLDLWKFEHLLTSGTMYFRRSDKLEDDHEGLPPEEYEHVLGLNRYDINDIRERDHAIGSIAQFRQAFYISSWHLFTQETARMWAQYGKDGVAIVSRYRPLKEVLDPIPDRPHLGLVRYGSEHLTGWNTMRFITTKRRQYSHEQEIRALLWLLDSGDAVNRHVDIDNRIHDRPLYEPPETLPEGITRDVALRTLITEVVVTPRASAATLAHVRSLVAAFDSGVPVRPSSLTDYARFIPTDEELRRFA